MKNLVFLFFCSSCIFMNSQSSYCNPTDMPVEIFSPNSTATPTANIGLQYLCGPNTIVYDTIGPQYCREVYINNNSTLYLLSGCPATDFIWVKNGCTLNIKSGSVGIIEIVAEPGAIINHPSGPHSYTSYTIACTSITYPNINCATGIIENNLGYDFKLYPNPTNSILNIKLDNVLDSEVFRIRLTDALGREITTTDYKSRLDISFLENGIYFVQISKNKSLLWTDKLMISK